MIPVFLLILAFISFVLAAIPKFAAYANFIAIGLALWSLSIILASGVFT